MRWYGAEAPREGTIEYVPFISFKVP